MVNLVQQAMHGTSIIPSRKDGRKSDENDESFILTSLFWLGFQIYLVKTLKLICQAPVRLIGKRGLICDHSQLFVYF